MTNKKFKDKARAPSCNVVSVSSKEIKEDVVSLTNSEEEESALIVDQDAPPMWKIRSGKQYLKKYDETVTSLPNQGDS